MVWPWVRPCGCQADVRAKVGNPTRPALSNGRFFQELLESSDVDEPEDVASGEGLSSAGVPLSYTAGTTAGAAVARKAENFGWLHRATRRPWADRANGPVPR